jgi:predicted AAA+ superfamily ATPase
MVSYWAPLQARQTEVDFLLRRGREYVAIEVKAQVRFSRTQLAGLRAIAELPRVVRRVLVYLGTERLRTEDGIDIWPLQTFLAMVARNKLWP